MLAPVAVEGDGISGAQAGLEPLANGKTGNRWIVSLQFTEEADQQFIDISEQIKVLDQPRNQFAITLDSLVISAPSIQKDTTFAKGNGVQITSGEGTTDTRQWATTLSNQLSFGALPMSFNVDSKEQVSASLGSEQLQKGLIAGLFGLLLVILYSLYQYHALGLVTIGSLTIASLMTYGTILVLSWQMGYRLSLPGIIGFIVSIGITADSFIVYFERIRDELRDGRSVDLAVSRGWKRALRTILASDTVNILAAVILYLLAVGGVRGFAFTLGLTTFIDLIVVLMFTHPIVVLMTKMRFFREGHPASGLDAFALGSKTAVAYRKLTAEEKVELKEQEKLQRLEKKGALVGDKLKKKELKAAEKAKKQESKIQAAEYELEMRKRLALLKEGADAEDIANTNLTIAERKALREGKDLTKLVKNFERAAKSVTSDDFDDDLQESAADKIVKPVAKKAVKKTAKTTTKTAAKKTATKSAAKTTAKPATKKPAEAKATPAKSATKATPKKAATSTKKPTATKKPAAPKKAANAKTTPAKQSRPPKAAAKSTTTSTKAKEVK
jgi:protein-export membrane protein SecD